MKIAEITRDSLSDWKRMRRAVYPDVSEVLHDKEMEIILAATDATCFLGFSDSGAAVAMIELTLRSHVDGCLGGPVGYVEGIYLDPEIRGLGNGHRLIEFAADWFRSRGCREMAADAELENTAAQEFLSRSGFDETYRIVEFKRSLDDESP